MMLKLRFSTFLFLAFAALDSKSQTMCGKLFSEYRSLGNGLFLQSFYSTYTISNKMVKFGKTYKITSNNDLQSREQPLSNFGINFKEGHPDTIKISFIETHEAHRRKGYYLQLFSAFLRDIPQVKRIETQLAFDNGNIGFKHLIAMLSKHPKFIQPDFTKTEQVQFQECCSEISAHDYKDHLIEAIKQTPSYKVRFENGFEKIDKPRVEFNSVWETFSIYYDAIRE